MPAQKTVEVDREKIISIIEKILEEPVGTEIFIPAASKKSQQDTHRCLIKELKLRSEFAPEDTEQISHRLLFRDGKFWIVLTKIEPTLSKIFVKRDGSLSKVDIS